MRMCLVLRVAMWMSVIVTMTMIMRMSVMAMIVAVAMIVLVSAIMICLFSMCLRMRRTFVFKPELWYRVPNYTSQCAEFSQGISHAVLKVVWQTQHQSCSAALHERDRREEDKDGNHAGSDWIPARPAIVLRQQGGDDDGHGA